MSALTALPLTDAGDWSGTIKVILTAVADHDNDDGSHTSIAGSATFTYTRVRLANKLTYGKLLFYGSTAEESLAGEGEFLPLQCAIGKMPGWLVIFGPQEPMENAFTRTVTFPSSGGNTPDPVVTHIDAYCSIAMVCAPCAPDRYIWNLDFIFTQTLVGLNNGLGTKPSSGPINEEPTDDPNKKKDVAYTVTLVREGIPATTDKPAVGNLYRVTFPDDCASLDPSKPLNIIYNGQTLKPVLVGSGYISNGGNVFKDLITGPDLTLGNSVQATVFPRSPYVLDVLMANYGDTLAAGTINYLSWGAYQKLDSTVTVNNQTEKLANPFNRSAGVSHTGKSSKDDDPSFDVQFS